MTWKSENESSPSRRSHWVGVLVRCPGLKASLKLEVQKLSKSKKIQAQTTLERLGEKWQGVNLRPVSEIWQGQNGENKNHSFVSLSLSVVHNSVGTRSNAAGYIWLGA